MKSKVSGSVQYGEKKIKEEENLQGENQKIGGAGICWIGEERDWFKKGAGMVRRGEGIA